MTTLIITLATVAVLSGIASVAYMAAAVWIAAGEKEDT